MKCAKIPNKTVGLRFVTNLFEKSTRIKIISLNKRTSVSNIQAQKSYTGGCNSYSIKYIRAYV